MREFVDKVEGEQKAKPKKVRVPVEELKELREKAARADEHFDRLLRLQADFENYKKRLEREKADFVKYANEDLIIRLLSVMDDFERAIDSARNSSNSTTLLQGVEMIRQHLQEVLEGKGLSKIDPVGEPFDPERHEAVMNVETTEHPEDTVVEVLRKGYCLNDKVLRPAIVKVAKKPHLSDTRPIERSDRGSEVADSRQEEGKDLDKKEPLREGSQGEQCEDSEEDQGQKET